MKKHILVALAGVLWTLAELAPAQQPTTVAGAKFSVIADFPASGELGEAPDSLVPGRDGNLYGTTTGGGAGGQGVAYRMTPKGQMSVLYSFGLQEADPQLVSGAMIQASDGNFYGVGPDGGTNRAGAVFRLSRKGALHELHAFVPGEKPMGSVVQAADRNLYGVSTSGGANGNGFVYRLSLKGKYAIIASFESTAVAGHGFNFGLTQGADGNLYGVSVASGPQGHGTLYRVSPAGDFAVVHAFAGGEAGGSPEGDLTLGADGMLYGTASIGGMFNGGVLFKIDVSGNYVKIFDFAKSLTGYISQPYGHLTIDSHGNLYGVTAYGDSPIQPYGGAVYRCTPDGIVTTLHSFVRGDDGAQPGNGVVEGADGSIFGVTQNYGGSNVIGTAYRVKLK